MVEGYSKEIGRPHYIHFSELVDLIILYLRHAFDGLGSRGSLRSIYPICQGKIKIISHFQRMCLRSNLFISHPPLPPDIQMWVREKQVEAVAVLYSCEFAVYSLSHAHVGPVQ